MSEGIGRLRQFADDPWFDQDGQPILERIGHAKRLLKVCADVAEAALPVAKGATDNLLPSQESSILELEDAVDRLFEATDREVEA